MTVEAVIGSIQLPVSKPGVFNFAVLRIPGVFQSLFRFFEPGEGLGLFEPESIWILNRALPHFLILLCAVYVGSGFDLCWWWESSLLNEDFLLFLFHRILLSYRIRPKFYSLCGNRPIGLGKYLTSIICCL